VNRSVFSVLLPLEVPFQAGRETDCGDAVSQELLAAGVAAEDHVDHLSRLVDDWLTTDGAPSGDLLKCVRGAVQAGMPGEPGVALASRYAQLFVALLKLPVDRSTAVRVISQAPLALHLAEAERMTATQVASLLCARLEMYIPHQAVSKLLGVLGVRIALDSEQVAALHDSDSASYLARFADADVVGAAKSVSAEAERLGFPTALDHLLLELAGGVDEGTAFFPYLQILTLQCVELAFFDHPPAYVYEFSPRGKVALEVFSRFPEALVATGNPILNNVKATEAADSAWARSRGPGAHALADILAGLVSMSYPARRELAALLRAWVLHVLSLADPGTKHFAMKDVPWAVVERLVEYVAAGNTNTYGVVEQRVVDALTSLLHPGPEWRPRGLGDPVNASNLARRKLGDADYQRPSAREVVCYEPHGGVLRRQYLVGHLQSLRRGVQMRLEEWQGIADADEWSLEVCFLAHDVEPDLAFPIIETIEGVEAKITYIRLADFVSDVVDSEPSDAVSGALLMHFFEVLDRRQTPQAVRLAVAEAIGVDLIDV